MEQKPLLSSLFRNNPETPEGKYLVKRRDGTVVEWPNFVLGARDPHAAVALRAYADSFLATASDREEGKEKEAGIAFAGAVHDLADLFDKYRVEHGEGDPGRGRHRKDDPAIVEEMKKGYFA